MLQSEVRSFCSIKVSDRIWTSNTEVAVAPEQTSKIDQNLSTINLTTSC